VARAMFNRALAMDASGNEAEALAEYARLIARFGDSDHPAVQELVACAMYNRAVAVEASGNETEALAEYGRLVIQPRHYEVKYKKHKGEQVNT
ncbi:tetratricopeptide repeat protein, partial [Salmonella enterica subsp. enterica serovar Chester]|nr:tetratricopeptide repeat protein [Salmonella enterica subsp. enterica serovar Chester]